ncbi:family S53 protease [Dentipellis sp. KUC8613]|nr:family S53 protease [Dentipellis sp. KUC8613]
MRSSFFLITLLAVVSASPAPTAMVVREKRDSVPSGYVKKAVAPADQVLELRLGLVQSDPKGLEDALMAVSTPGSARRGQFLTKEETEAFVAPTQESLDAVNAFLTSQGLTATKFSPAGDILAVNMTVEQANKAFATQFTTFTHEASGQQSVRTLEYSIPAALQGHLDFVHPTVTFSRPLSGKPLMSIPLPPNVNPAKNLTGDAVPASCSSVITPACLQALYGIPASSTNPASNKLGVSGFIDQFANQQDLRTFLTNLATNVPAATGFTLQTLDGGSNPQTQSEAGIEANLDTQYTIGNAPGVPVTFISVGDNTRDGVFGFLDIINFLLGESAPPQVLTTSYGSNENEISSSLANNLCNAYAQLGARGTSILFSSGDGGVSGSQSGSCSTFVPTFPSGCPFMTSVGATTGVPETSASFSSGGFSNTFAQPSYQASAVSAFLTKLGNTNSGKFNRAGRGFPDVAAQGDNVEIVFQQEFGLVAGTSCSSPIFASVVSLLNGELIAAGKPALGFLNPFLYSTGASALTDITTGDNPGCGTNGFPAVAGWDPVTGLGTPNFAALRTAVGL